MIRGLVEKELRQHGMALALMFGALASGLILLNANPALTKAAGTSLEALHIVLMAIAPFSSLLLNQLLVAGEFRNKTQLFLEGLPLPRWRMLAVEYCLGLAMMLLGLGIVFAISLQRSLHTDAMTPHFALILASKAAVWIWFVHSVLYAHGFLGRYRIAFAVAVVAVLLLLEKSGLPIGNFCAFQLVDARFAYERLVFPAESLIETGVCILAFTGFGFWLGLMRDSTVASLLSERMSRREKTFLTFATIASIMAITYIEEREQAAAPVRLPGAYETSRGAARVSATSAVDSPGRRENDAAKRVATHVAEGLDRVASYLGCSTLPPVFIVHRRDLSGMQFENGDLKPGQGLLVRANLTASDFNEDALFRWIVREELLVKSSGRAGLEKNAWVLAGFPQWWAQINATALTRASATAAPPKADPGLATSIMPPNFSEHSLRNWLSVEKELGEEKSRSLACAGLAALAANRGPAACQQFLRDMLGREISKDARGWLFDMADPMPARFKNAAGITLGAFVTEWRAGVQKDGKLARQ